MASYRVSCRGSLSGGAIAHLRDAGIYRSAVPERGVAGSAAATRHYLAVEARNPEDALLIARGALAVAGGGDADLDVGEPPPDRPRLSR
jgi:hypothetical protein